MKPLVICYHGVSRAWPNPTAVSESLLGKQLKALLRRGYSGVTVRQLVEGINGGPLPRKPVAITFDDGYQSTLRAKPLLDEAGFPATVFVVTHFVESGELLTWPGVHHWSRTPHAEEMRSLTWQELEQLVEAGWEVGSHTTNHFDLVQLGAEELDHELAGSRVAIANRLGACKSMAYPYGSVDDRVVAAVERAGYVAGCAGLSLSRVGDRYRMPRVGLYGHDAGLRLAAKLSSRFVTLRLRSIGKRPSRLARRRPSPVEPFDPISLAASKDAAPPAQREDPLRHV